MIGGDDKSCEGRSRLTSNAVLVLFAIPFFKTNTRLFVVPFVGVVQHK